MREAILTGLAGLLIAGCAATKVVEQPKPQRTYTPEEIAVRYIEDMETLEKTKEGEADGSNKDFNDGLKKYGDDTNKRYEEAMKKVEEERRRYNPEGQ